MKVLTREYEVRPYELGADGRLKTTSLVDFLQDIAGEHADLLGVGMKQLMPDGLTWFALRYHIRVSRWPGLRERVTIRSWPSARKRLQAIRDFEVRDAEGALLAVAASAWVIVDPQQGRPVKLEHILSEFADVEQRAIETNFPRIPALAPDPAAPAELYRALREHCDANGHVNNAVYLAWALDAMPPALQDMRPAEIEIAFKGECRPGERVAARTQLIEEGDTPVTLHLLTAPESGAELVRQRTRWARF
ncbi:MAG: hypothetical protein KAI66_12960 [Lentisphaeria bacterium]|nr:hypothetical protein [Lentisphaeria bacterium]